MQQYLIEKKAVSNSVKLIAASLVIIIFISIIGFTNSPSLPIEFSKPFPVKSTNIPLTVKGIGKIVPRTTVLISAPDDGQITKIQVRSGKMVEKGTILAQITNYSLEQDLQEFNFELANLRSEVELAKSNLLIRKFKLGSNLAKAQTQLNRQSIELEANKKLVAQQIVSKIKHQQEKMSLEQLQLDVISWQQQIELFKQSHKRQIAALDNKVRSSENRLVYIKKRISSLTLRAQVSGIVKEVKFNLGQRVSQGQSLFELIEPEQLIARIQIPQYSSEKLALGQRAKIITPSGTLDARIEHVDNIIRQDSISIFLAITGSLPKWLRVDQSVEAVISTPQQERRLYTYKPQKFEKYDSWVFYQVDNNGIANKIEVIYNDDAKDILSLNHHQLKDGDHVLIIPIEYAKNNEFKVSGTI
ncbi:MAG: HlyD family efflux transporter periplasmic adaptor subunit [Alteromonadaceae bacterium]|nr:HlyD family efflux transporter periplasmic adaptor subunit [Alteromonadaceae bacterium]